MADEITVDKCVITHCDSAAADATQYRKGSLAFVEHFRANTAMVVCVNPGIRQEYATFSAFGKIWWASVTQQSSFCDKTRKIKQPQRVDFRKKRNVPLHGTDFDYVDAAHQSSSLLWLTNEATWANPAYRQRIRGQFDVEVLNINEYIATISTLTGNDNTAAPAAREATTSPSRDGTNPTPPADSTKGPH